MNTTAIAKTVSKTLHKTGFKMKKYSPEILAVTGVIGIVTSAVMACKATTKVSEILENTKEQVDTIHDCAADPDIIKSGKYTEDDAKKDLAIVYVQTGVKLVKLYAPSVILGVMSIGSTQPLAPPSLPAMIDSRLFGSVYMQPGADTIN